VLGFYEKEIVLTLAKRNFYIKKIFEGVDIPYGLFNQKDELVSIAWLNKAGDNEKPPIFVNSDVSLVDDCYTSRAERSKGYYTFLIHHIAKLSDKPVVLYTNNWNEVSSKGAISAGYILINRRLKRGENKYTWI
jgi:hypothetical protein